MDAQQKTQLERRVVAGLLVVFAVVFFLGPLKSMGLFKRQAAPAPSTPEMTPPDQAQAPGVPQQRPVEPAAPVPVARYTAHDLRDPLQSLLPTQKTAGSQGAIQQDAAGGVEPVVPTTPALPVPLLTVQGLWWGSEQPKAIINGDVYGVDETVDGAKILSIGRDGVIIEWGGQAIPLTTQPGSSEAMTMPPRPR